MASSRTILLTIAEPGLPPAAPQRFALFELGFRPFYLLGSAFAVIAMLQAAMVPATNTLVELSTFEWGRSATARITASRWAVTCRPR